MVVSRRFRALFALQVFGALLELENPAFLCSVALESHGVGRLERCVGYRLVPFTKNLFLLSGLSIAAIARE